jgi:4-diphosphocytidyl-2-C-methyl-D-erythritol kinase
MRGRGERISPLPSALAASLQDQPIYLFKPDFSISTPWAYSKLKAMQSYTPPDAAEAALQAFTASLTTDQPCFTNDFLRPLALKYPLIPLFLAHMKAQGFACGLTGSGSACFVWMKDGSASTIESQVVEAFGPHCFRMQTSISF